MSMQKENGIDHQLHSDTIRSISERYNVDESTIRAMYESRLEELSFNATITSFLPVLIEHYVKTKLHFMHGS